MPILVTRSSLPPFEEYQREIASLWDSHWLTNMGIKHKELETALSSSLAVPHVSLFTNGHLALEMAIQALGLAGEVITTPFTFVSTTHAIVRNGLKPVFCDIKESDYTLDPSLIESLITEKTSAIVPVHVYGNICDVEAIEKIASRYNLKVLYDAAHAFGETYKGRGVGSFGNASMFSFHATKVFHTIEGGAVTTSEGELKKRLDMTKNYGITGPEEVELVGGNAKMNEFQASMGLCNLRHLDEEIEKRRKVVERYRENLGGVMGIRLNAVDKDVVPNHAYFPVIFDSYRYSRDEVFNRLEEHDIHARKYFYPAVNTLSCYRNQYSSDDTPVSSYIAERVLTLPLFADLSLTDVDRICDIILS